MLKLMFKLIFSLFLTSGMSYELIEGYIPVYPKIITPCHSIHKNLLKTTNEATNYLTYIGFPISLEIDNSTGTICNYKLPEGEYGHTTIRSNNTIISISNRLLFVSTTLYNVVLHELLHSLGIDHSKSRGMMGYKIRTHSTGYPKRDERKLWPSMSDIAGLQSLL